MRSSGLIFEGKRYWSPTGVRATTPPDGLPDVSGLENDGTFVNNASWVQLPSGLWVIDLEATSDDHVTIANAPSINIVSQSFTYIVWFKAESLSGSGQYLFMRGAYNTDGWSIPISSAGAVQAVTYQSGTSQLSYTANGVVTVGAWNMIAVSRNGSSVKINVNGLYANSGSGTHTNPVTNSRTAYLGSYDATQYHCDGLMSPPYWVLKEIRQEGLNYIYAKNKGWFE